jgi:predicted flap endonuclease-1-like 5' DNA nuclease
MLFSTPTQFAVLALCLLIGWLFGLASHPGGRKWKERHRTEEAAHAAYRREAEAELTAARARITTLEAERDRALAAAPARTGVLHGAAPIAGAAAAAGSTTHEGGGWRSWFGGGRGDDLTRIRGINEPLARQLSDHGIHHYADIEKLSAADERALEERLALPANSIARDGWREQAAMLRAGDMDGHQRRFGV